MKARTIVMLVLTSMTSLCSGHHLDDLRHMPLDLTDHEAVVDYVRKVAFSDPEAHAARRKRAVADEPEEAVEELTEQENDKGDDNGLAEQAMTNVQSSMESAQNVVEKALETSDGKPPKEIRIDINSGQGEIDGKDLELPPVSMDVEIKQDDDAGSVNHGTPNTGFAPFTIGLGGGLMNGCYGSGYVKGDPCWTWVVLEKCADLLEACSYVGVGFDATGVYGPESRKGSVLGFTCIERRYYNDGQGQKKDVPDMMRISGTYEAQSQTKYFESAQAYQESLEFAAGIKGTSGGFSASIEAAYGQKMTSKIQEYLAVFEVNIMRYEVYINKFHASMLDTLFMKEFIDLPLNYYEEGAARKYQEFIFRWGTHYVVSAEFGGKLEIRQSMQSSLVTSLQKFEVEARAAYKGFWSMAGYFGAKGSFAGADSSKNMSVSIQVEGGSPMIAEAIADRGSTDIRADLHEWLLSIANYPKPFNFRLSRLTDLVGFTEAELWDGHADQNATWGCASNTLETDEHGSFVMLNLETTDEETNVTTTEAVKRYCQFTSRDALTLGIAKRRESLETAITAYLLQGPVSYGQFDLQGVEDCYTNLAATSSGVSVPNWDRLTHDEFRLRLAFPEDISSSLGELKSDEQFVAGRNARLKQWYYKDIETEEIEESFSMYTSDDLMLDKTIAIAGLYMSYDDREGYFSMSQSDYQRSLVQYPNLPPNLADGRPLAYPEAITSFHSYPCSYTFTNAQRLDIDYTDATCIRFLAASDGPIYVIAASNPERKSTWYTTLISPDGIAFYKGMTMVKQDTSIYISGLGSETVLQTYFVCISKVDIAGQAALVLEYGKATTSNDTGIIYMSMVDVPVLQFPTYYAFGAGEKKVAVSEAKLTHLTDQAKECGTNLVKETALQICIDANCHEQCEPIAGCYAAVNGNPQPDECVLCKNNIDYINGRMTCVANCRENFVPYGDSRLIDLGCWNDTLDRALPSLEGTDPILDGTTTSRINAIDKCLQVVKKRRFEIFGIQNGGKCTSSATAAATYNKHGPATNCQSDGEGGAWSYQVYQIIGVCQISCPDNLEERDGDCVCRLQEGSVCVDSCSADKVAKINIGEGAIYICDCIIRHNEVCVTVCPPLTAKTPDLIAGFFKCADPKGVEILTGQRASIGAIPLPEVTSIEACFRACAEAAAILDPTSCGGYEWDARDGGKCSVHSEVTACGDVVADSEVTLVRTVICAAPEKENFGTVIVTHTVPPRGRWITDAVRFGSEMSYEDCKAACLEMSAVMCSGLSYHVDTSTCWLADYATICPYEYKYDPEWVSLENFMCPYGYNYAQSPTCRYSYSGKGYVGSQHWTPDRKECEFDTRSCRNPTNGKTKKMPYCRWKYMTFWKREQYCAIPMCAPYGYEVIDGYCESEYEAISTVEYDTGAMFSECADACTVRGDCLQFIWIQNDSDDTDDHSCKLLSSLACGADLKTDGWGFQYTKIEPSYLD